jgi:adenine deaminase
MKNIIGSTLAFVTSLALCLPLPAIAQDDAPAQTLFTNVQIFDGVNEERMAGNVLVEGNLIKQVSAGPHAVAGFH